MAALADVLARLMAGDDLATIAEVRGSTIETIRGYAKQLFKQLRCNSQTQLVSAAWRAITVLAPYHRGG